MVGDTAQATSASSPSRARRRSASPGQSSASPRRVSKRSRCNGHSGGRSSARNVSACTGAGSCDTFEPRARELEQTIAHRAAARSARPRCASTRRARGRARARNAARRRRARRGMSRARARDAVRKRERALRFDAERKFEPAFESIGGPIAQKGFGDEAAHAIELIERIGADAARKFRARQPEQIAQLAKTHAVQRRDGFRIEPARTKRNPAERVCQRTTWESRCRPPAPRARARQSPSGRRERKSNPNAAASLRRRRSSDAMPPNRPRLAPISTRIARIGDADFRAEAISPRGNRFDRLTFGGGITHFVDS